MGRVSDRAGGNVRVGFFLFGSSCVTDPKRVVAPHLAAPPLFSHTLCVKSSKRCVRYYCLHCVYMGVVWRARTLGANNITIITFKKKLYSKLHDHKLYIWIGCSILFFNIYLDNYLILPEISGCEYATDNGYNNNTTEVGGRWSPKTVPLDV